LKNVSQTARDGAVVQPLPTVTKEKIEETGAANLTA
jgi:hypothetical protein